MQLQLCSLSTVLFLSNVLRELSQCSLEDLLDLTNLSFALLLVIDELVVFLDHLDHLILIVARYDKLVNFLLLLNLAAREEARYLLIVDDTLADGRCRVLFDLITPFLGKLNKLLVMLHRHEALIRV